MRCRLAQGYGRGDLCGCLRESGDGVIGWLRAAGDPVPAWGREIAYRRVFGEAPAGELFWYVNSMGLVEVAVSQGSAAEVLKMGIGASLMQVSGCEQGVSA
ncbi:SAM hydroxide adenosyltransferase [Ectothiorhodospira sp. BSL-9]|uniref:SAM hydroxide adenosyltransferase n=1 Tax=Ectothiorhodospira sp. BSL-9 TaxID=1442136 RepID=UPI002110E603|nr:SAM hydroxide adenosyltransferase [Ectothiorhodospira sp. BSL-9]